MKWQLEHHNYETNYWWFRSRRNVLKIFLDKIDTEEKESVLEIGCGTGGNLKYLFNDYNEIFGLDFDKPSLEIAKKNSPDSILFNIDANDLSSIDHKFDLIAILDVLYNKNIKNPKIVLEQTHKMLKKNGYILISEPAFNILSGNHSNTVDEKRRFYKKELEKIIETSNYDIMFSNYWGVTIFFILYIKRRILDRFFIKKASPKTDLISIPIIDKIFYFIMIFENSLIKHIKNPFGSSIIVLAKKIAN